MKEHFVSDTLSYIGACDGPLSADIGIVRENGLTVLYDVGCGAERIAGLEESDFAVLSHFHRDHSGNVGLIRPRGLYVSKETFCHVGRGTVVTESLELGPVRLFPLPSSHARGCLGMETGDFAFVGDALYGCVRGGELVYNVQLLAEEIAVLAGLRARTLLVSHVEGLIRGKAEVLDELRALYARRQPGVPEIRQSLLDNH